MSEEEHDDVAGYLGCGCIMFIVVFVLGPCSTDNDDDGFYGGGL